MSCSRKLLLAIIHALLAESPLAQAGLFALVLLLSLLSLWRCKPYASPVCTLLESVLTITLLLQLLLIDQLVMLLV